MSAADLVMDSEKEETVTSIQHVEIQQEEVVPGSSPEGVFPNEDGQMFEDIEHSNGIAPHQLPLHVEELKHGEEIVEEQNGMLHQSDQLGEMIEEENEQQFMNMVQVTQEDVYEAGFDVDDLNHLTEEQLNIVVAISQQRQAKQEGQVQAGDEDGDGHHHMMHHGMMGNEFDGQDGTGGDGHEFEGDEVNEQMQIILTNDGGVNITDSKQQQIYISPAEIASLNIDLNNFTNDHVQQLLQLALPSIKESDDKNQGVSYSRDVLDQEPSTSYHHHHHDQVEADKDHRSPMIGETVQIRTPDGRLQEAVVKYVRGNSDFKIQFMDGEFAYATMDQMLPPHRGRNHDGYHVGTQMLIRRSDMSRLGHKRAAGSVEELLPPVLKRSYQLAPVVDGPHVVPTPNFCCPICDKKVFQKEPSYIVIRLPACDSCTREKIIVLDEQNS